MVAGDSSSGDFNLGLILDSAQEGIADSVIHSREGVPDDDVQCGVCLEDEPEEEVPSILAMEWPECERTRPLKIGIDSGAELSVLPRQLFPEIPIEETEASRNGVKYFGPGDLHEPTIKEYGETKLQMIVESTDGKPQLKTSRFSVADVRKALMCVAEMTDKGHDVVFKAYG